MRSVLAPTLAALAIAAHAAPSTSIDVAKEFVDAWNSHDADRFADLFTDDAVWVPIVETRLSGRQDIVADLRQAHTTWARRTTMALSDVMVTPLSGTEAIVLFRAGFLGRDGQRIEPANAVLVVLVKESGGWRIKAGQLSKPGATAMPAK